jgi:hypothetical protein
MPTDERGENDAAHDVRRDAQRVKERAHLLPEEETAGSDDPEAQAAAVLADSEERTEVPNAAPDTHLERRGPMGT